MKIVCNGTVIGESSDVIIEGRECYFPESDVRMQFLSKNSEVLYCPDKGYGVNYDICGEGNTVHGSAWGYPHPYPKSAALKGRIGFKLALVVE